jgi:two-component system response regulator PilR (NtrC family)
MAHILVVDDELSMRELLGIMLRKGGHRVSAVGDGQRALEVAEKDPPDLVIHDLKMPGMGGIELLQRLKARAPDLPCIVITAFSTWDNTVEAMRLGAYDYVKKPFDTDEIREVVERALTHRKIAGQASERPELPEMRELVGNSAKMREALDIARRVAPTEATVLLQGESGTGKELFARMLHYYSSRAAEPFIGVNCGAFPESLLESELFGHVRGSFTGAHADKRGLLQLADGGTFFLDEVGELPLSMQVRLLRVLEERQFYPVGGTKAVRIDVRFVCATNRDLAEEVRGGNFRGDLYFRLNVVPIVLPPLRERAGDVPLLAGYFVRKYAKQLGRSITGISPAVQARLEAYAWPGNVRELENAIQRAIALARGPVIEEVQLSDAVFAPRPAAAPLHVAAPVPVPVPAPMPAAHGAADRVAPDGDLDAPVGADVRLAPPLPPVPESGMDLEATLAAIERRYIEDALARTDGNLTRAADLLGISFRSIRYKVKKLGIRA